MRPGIRRYFTEWARFWQRLSLITTLASAALVLVFLTPFLSSDVREALNDPARFGFSGPEQYVRRIQLTSLGDPRGGRSTSRMIEPEIVPEKRKGGGGLPEPSETVGQPTSTRDTFKPPGVGDSEEDVLARAMLRAGDKPLFQSQELVIVRLVEPEYPEEARTLGIEGRVAILALVDTEGLVREAEIVGAADDVLERAALAAVLQCRFQPYTVNGEAQEVYAMFRFAFRLLN